MSIQLSNDNTALKALEALLKKCHEDPKLVNDVSIHLIVNAEKPIGIKNDYVPRLIPLSKGSMKKAVDLSILLICKDPSEFYRNALIADEATSNIFKEIIGLKKLKQRYRGKKLKELYNNFDLVVSDYRVHHLLPEILGSSFYHSKKKLPFMIRMSKQIKEKRVKMKEECDPKYIRAQIRSICKNTWYIPNKDNCLSVKIGEIDVHDINQILNNAQDVIEFLCDKNKRPQGGCLAKTGISSLFVKTSNSVSLPIWNRPEVDDADSEEEIKL